MKTEGGELPETTQRVREDPSLPRSTAWASEQGAHALPEAALTLSLIPAGALAPVLGLPSDPAPVPVLILPEPGPGCSAPLPLVLSLRQADPQCAFLPAAAPPLPQALPCSRPGARTLGTAQALAQRASSSPGSHSRKPSSQRPGELAV